MIRAKFCWLLLLAGLVLGVTGCASFVARRIAQAPNRYPTWFAPKARVWLAFSPKFLTNFPARFVDVGPPKARLRYRVVEPADYHLQVSATNWLEHGQEQFEFRYDAELPGRSNVWTASPRGTVVLLHGWGVGMFAMAPWAVRLAEDGWRCVLVDLRGHGKSTGPRIYFGVREARDLSQLLDQLESDGRLARPVAAVGESYGAALSLRWKAADPRVGPVVAIAPYPVLSNAVLNISHDYVPWMPKTFVRAGVRKLPAVLQLPADELDTTTVMKQASLPALFIAGAEDKVTPLADVAKLQALAAPGSELIIVPRATHEAVTYFFNDLVPPVLAWLARTNASPQEPGEPSPPEEKIPVPPPQ